MALDPQYTTTPNVNSATQLTANNVYNGTGTVGTCFTAGANGSFVGYIRIKPLGTNVPSVARFWINNGLTNATAANNFLIAEVTLPTTTTSAVAAIQELSVPLNFALPATYKINFAVGTTVASGWQATVIGGDY
jgi:hypothetical protein